MEFGMEYYSNSATPLGYYYYWQPIPMVFQPPLYSEFMTSINCFPRVEFGGREVNQNIPTIKSEPDNSIKPKGEEQSKPLPHKITEKRKSKARQKANENSKRRVRNTESNICNQALAYIICSSRSESVLRGLLIMEDCQDVNEVCHLYYEYVRVLNRHRRCYLTKKFMLQLFINPSCGAFEEILSNSRYDELRLSKSEFARLTRILLWHFLNMICRSTILTSKKIRKDLIRHHSARRQEICGYLREAISRQGNC